MEKSLFITYGIVLEIVVGHRFAMLANLIDLTSPTKNTIGLRDLLSIEVRDLMRGLRFKAEALRGFTGRGGDIKVWGRHCLV